jgi:uncharacterized membrane protein YgcG
MTRRLLVGLLATALLPAAAADANTMKGTVVHRNHKAHSFVVAGRSGKLRAVHSTRTPAVGRQVSFRARQLSNGTFSTKSFKVRGRSDRARLVGTVTFVDSASRTFTLSDDGASILVHVADETIALPAVGDAVRVIANLDDSTASTVEATGVTVLPAPPANAVKLEGVVLAIDETTRTLMLSADDSDASGQAVSVALPDTFDITAFHVGDRVEMIATLNPDGTTFTAVASSGDDNATEADDQGDDQGQDVGDDQGEDVGDDQGEDVGDDHGDDNPTASTPAAPGASDDPATDDSQTGGDIAGSDSSGSGSSSSGSGSSGSGDGGSGGHDG